MSKLGKGQTYCVSECFHCGADLGIEISQADEQIEEDEWCEFTFTCEKCEKQTTRVFFYEYSFDPEAEV